MSTLPEIHLLPTELQSIIELVKTHDRDIAAKLDDSYHTASFNVTFSRGPVCFINKELTHEEAEKVQEWLLHEENKTEVAAKVKHFGHLVDAWRPVTGDHL
ncbi:MAG: hypothetical protein OEY06_11630 [Gammaproteobacteria bacterium]|nr:hypothetical protein [Gammaproteobacteria bacterium]